MSGFFKLYCIGGLGGFQGADGIGPIRLQLLVGTGGRMWIEPHYFDPSIKPLGKLRVLIPARPDDAHLLIDACLAFYPDHFKSCPLLPTIAQELGDTERLDFDLRQRDIPRQWAALREQARPLFHQLHIWEADLKLIDLEHYVPLH